MPATNTNIPGNNPGYNAAQHVINQRAVSTRDTDKAVKAMIEMGKADGSHVLAIKTAE